jgi:hypothetical protein
MLPERSYDREAIFWHVPTTTTAAIMPTMMIVATIAQRSSALIRDLVVIPKTVYERIENHNCVNRADQLD